MKSRSRTMSGMSQPGYRSDSDIARLRIPPQSISAEQSVLGGLLLVPESFDLVADILTASDFYRRDHRLIYRAISELTDKSLPIDVVTVGDWFINQGLTEMVAGGAYLVELATTTPSAANIAAYAKIVRDKAILRSMIEVGSGIVNVGFETEGREAAELLDDAERKLLAVGDAGRTSKKEVTSLIHASRDAFKLIQERYAAGGDLTGLPTGYTEFDGMTSGLQDDDLIVLAARPSMGKTALALCVAEHIARHRGKAVLVFSMEMSASQLALRLMSSVGRIDAGRLRSGKLEDEEWGLLTHAISTIKDMNILIDDTPAMSPEALRAKARRIKREHPTLGLIVVDYLQLMQVPGSEENRATEVSQISRNLKALAKELNMPVVALSQLNRSLETRSDKRPVMADLRESGAIEQDADVIVFIYRDEYYNKESQDKGLAEIIIGKQRNGPTGSFKLRFFGQYTRFENLANDSVGCFE